jgi:hypothetical protein
MTAPSLGARRRPLQFSLATLFEFTALCAVLAACKPLIGILAAAVLMCIPPALAIGNGLLVLALYFIACGAAENIGDTTAISTIPRLALVFVLTFGLCAWVQCRGFIAVRHSRPLHPSRID